MIKDLNVRPKTTKLLEENIKNKILDIGLGYDVLDLIPKAKVSKAKVYLCLVMLAIQWFPIMLVLQRFPITVRKILRFSLELTGSDMSCSLIAPLLTSYFFPH